MKDKYFTVKSRMTVVVMPILLILAVMAFPVVIATGYEVQNPTYSQEITLDNQTVSTASGTICWGLKRGSNGSIPEIPSSYKFLLERYGAKYVGDTTRRVIYLTFDEGYENGYTAQILDILKQRGVKAVFFITGDYFNENPELIRRMIEEGHTVGNHTMNHPSLPSISAMEAEEEILSLDRRMQDKFGYEMFFLRPPKGEFSEKTLALAANLGYRCLMWSFAYKDWVVSDQKGKDYAVQTVTENLHCGAILLLHAVSKDNAQGLDEMITKCQMLGYSFGSPEELAQ